MNICAVLIEILQRSWIDEKSVDEIDIGLITPLSQGFGLLISLATNIRRPSGRAPKLSPKRRPKVLLRICNFCKWNSILFTLVTNNISF